MTSQILKSAGFTKTRKSQYLEIDQNMLIKTEYTVIFKFKYVSTTVFLNFTTLHVYSSYLQVELFITTILYYYIKKLLITE